MDHQDIFELPPSAFVLNDFPQWPPTNDTHGLPQMFQNFAFYDQPTAMFIRSPWDEIIQRAPINDLLAYSEPAFDSQSFLPFPDFNPMNIFDYTSSPSSLSYSSTVGPFSPVSSRSSLGNSMNYPASPSSLSYSSTVASSSPVSSRSSLGPATPPPAAQAIDTPLIFYSPNQSDSGRSYQNYPINYSSTNASTIKTSRRRGSAVNGRARKTGRRAVTLKQVILRPSTTPKEKPHHCPLPGCTMAWERAGDLERHMQTKDHRKKTGKPGFVCQVVGCTWRHPYTRIDSRLRHMTRHHTEQEIQEANRLEGYCGRR